MRALENSSWDIDNKNAFESRFFFIKKGKKSEKKNKNKVFSLLNRLVNVGNNDLVLINLNLELLQI